MSYTADKLSRLTDTTDYSSCSNADALEVLHIDLDWEVDFRRKVLSGVATLRLQATVEGVSQVILDTRDLTIRSCSVNGSLATHALGEATEAFGASLTISLPAPVPKDNIIMVAVDYETSPDATAIGWLPPAQTAGKKYPYLFTQCQAIHARSMLPCMDAPGKKSTYKAKVTTPSWATAVMSGIQSDPLNMFGEGFDPSAVNAEEEKVVTLRLLAPIPTHLPARRHQSI